MLEGRGRLRQPQRGELLQFVLGRPTLLAGNALQEDDFQAEEHV